MKVDEAMRQCLEEVLNENPMLTLKVINEKLRERFPHHPVVHVRTVAKHLRPVSTQENKHGIRLDSFPSCNIHTAGPKKLKVL